MPPTVYARTVPDQTARGQRGETAGPVGRSARARGGMETMKFNVQRVLTPAYLTSIALVVVGVLFGLVWSPVAAWLFALAGLALNAVAVSVTEINDAQRAPGRAPRRRPSLAARDVRAGDEDGVLAEDRADDPDAVLPPEGAGRGTPGEPEAETQATPVVPSAGSSAFDRRR